jgi:hypothetical protein
LLSWISRQLGKIERIEAEADELIHNLGAGAYSAARRREHEASSEAMARHWRRVAVGAARPAGVWASTLQPGWRRRLTSQPKGIPALHHNRRLATSIR